MWVLWTWVLWKSSLCSELPSHLSSLSVVPWDQDSHWSPGSSFCIPDCPWINDNHPLSSSHMLGLQVSVSKALTVNQHFFLFDTIFPQTGASRICPWGKLLKQEQITRDANVWAHNTIVNPVQIHLVSLAMITDFPFSSLVLKVLVSQPKITRYWMKPLSERDQRKHDTIKWNRITMNAQGHQKCKGRVINDREQKNPLVFALVTLLLCCCDMPWPREFTEQS